MRSTRTPTNRWWTLVLVMIAALLAGSLVSVPAYAQPRKPATPLDDLRVVSAPRFPPRMAADRPSPPTPNRRPSFRWAAAGDSFGSGEGNPVTRSSDPERVRWVRGTASQSATRRGCHRSANAPAPRVHRRLAIEFPEIGFAFRHVACSGATIEDLTNRRVDAGPDRHVTINQSAQLSQVRRFAAGRSLDALYLNIGGNDAGFGDILTACIFFSCGPDMEQGADGLQARWDAMDDSFDDLQSVGIEGTLARTTPANVLITAVPDFSQDTDGSACAADDYDSSELLHNVDAQEITWTIERALGTMNANIESAAERHGWDFIDDHLAAWRGHGLCSSVPFAHTNTSALAGQGDDFISANADQEVILASLATLGPLVSAIVAGAGAVFVPAAFDLGDGLSAGIAHPNAAGYRTYESALLRYLRPLVRAAATDGLRPATNGRIANARPNGDITVRWRDRSTTETHYQITTRVLEGARRLGGRTFRVESGSQFVHRAAGPAVITYEIRACNRLGCSQPAFVTGGNRAPRLAAISAGKTRGLGVDGQRNSVVVDWPDDFSVVRWYLRQRQTAPVTTTATADLGQVSGYAIDIEPGTSPTYSFEVVGCNWIACTRVRSTTIDTSALVRTPPLAPKSIQVDPNLATILNRSPLEPPLIGPGPVPKLAPKPAPKLKPTGRPLPTTRGLPTTFPP